MILAGFLRVTIPALLSLILIGGGAREAFQRGLLALQENRLHAALTELTKAEKEDPNDAQVHNFRGIVLAELGKKAAAAEEYRTCIRLDPDASDAYRNLGYLEWTERHLDRATLELHKALKVNPKDRYARYYLGRVELDQGHDRLGLQNIASAGIPWPDEPDFLLAAAAGYLKLHQKTQARQLLGHLERLQLNETQTVRVGALLLRAHRPEEALMEIQRLVARHPDASWAKFDLVLANLKAGHLHKAVSISKPLTAQGGDAAPWIVLGIAYARLNEAQPSIGAFRRAIAIDPKREGLWLDLTRELMGTGDSSGAVSATEEGLTHIPRSYALHIRLGAAYMQAGRYKQADEVFRKMIAMGDPTATSTIGLAQVLLRTGHPLKADRALALAQHRLGASFLLVYFQGIALARGGKPAEAAAMFQEAVRLNPHSSDAFQWLGSMQLRMRKIPNAIQNLKTALRLNASDVQARRLLVQAYAMEHNPRRAMQVSTELTETKLPKPPGISSSAFPEPAWEMPEQAAH